MPYTHEVHAEPRQVAVRDFTATEMPFVSVEVGDTSIFLRSAAVLDRLEQAIGQARTMLTAVAA